jgi:hypothetical protein
MECVEDKIPTVQLVKRIVLAECPVQIKVGRAWRSRNRQDRSFSTSMRSIGWRILRGKWRGNVGKCAMWSVRSSNVGGGKWHRRQGIGKVIAIVRVLDARENPRRVLRTSG